MPSHESDLRALAVDGVGASRGQFDRFPLVVIVPGIRGWGHASTIPADLPQRADAFGRQLRPARQYWDDIKRDLKPIYTAVNATAARTALEELADKWGPRYPAVVRLWDNAWEEFIPFLDYDVEIRRVIARRTRSSRSTPDTGAR